MVIAFKRLVDLWRERLACLEARLAAGSLEPWRHQMERRVLAYLLRRHDDAEYADPPRAAEQLDAESARRTERLRLRREVGDRLGLDAPEDYDALNDWRAGGRQADDWGDELPAWEADDAGRAPPPMTWKGLCLRVLLGIAVFAGAFLLAYLAAAHRLGVYPDAWTR
ncbi:MAG: hypothetical protein M5U26_01740 [Planctomycetota bacterium]|nr:hypothetical protein [Planctomycetota bacterium]